jgi:hypothetical protein
MFLVGVFLPRGAYRTAIPRPYNFSDKAGIGQNFPSLQPELAQLFFIGDGRADSGRHGHGRLQMFIIPSGASKLYLGFAYGGNFSGVPCCYEKVGAMLTTRVTLYRWKALPRTG